MWRNIFFYDLQLRSNDTMRETDYVDCSRCTFNSVNRFLDFFIRIFICFFEIFLLSSIYVLIFNKPLTKKVYIISICVFLRFSIHLVRHLPTSASISYYFVFILSASRFLHTNKTVVNLNSNSLLFFVFFPYPVLMYVIVRCLSFRLYAVLLDFNYCDGTHSTSETIVFAQNSSGGIFLLRLLLLLPFLFLYISLKMEMVTKCTCLR